MKISQAPSTRQPDASRSSMPFRVLAAGATCLLLVLGLTSMQPAATSNPLTWGAALLAGGFVFVQADVLLAFLVVATPPGLFVLALAAFLLR